MRVVRAMEKDMLMNYFARVFNFDVQVQPVRNAEGGAARQVVSE
jgi:hypothetical protein